MTHTAIDIQAIDIQTIAIKAGLLVEEVEGSGTTYWTEGDYLTALETFASLIILAHEEETTT